jgi:dTDP-glucose 4,6-dehydratase
MAYDLSQDLDHVLNHTEPLWKEWTGGRLFITGGTGFVGIWLLQTFIWAAQRLALKAKAIVLTRNPEAFLSKEPRVARSPWIELLKGSVEEFSAPGDFDLIIHAATERSFDPTPDEPSGTFLRDIEGTRNVLEFAARARASRFLFTSSGAVYGKQPHDLMLVPEDYSGAPSTVDPQSTYGQAKRASEFLCTMYARQFGFKALIARLFAFSGPYLPTDLNFAVGNFVRDVLHDGPIRIEGDGTPYRSYLYAADLAIWLWTILFKGESARPYNVGSEQAVSIAELAHAVAANTRPETPIQIAKELDASAKPARYVPSISRARDELDLKPLVSLEEGIRRMYAWNNAVRSLP